MRYVWIVLLVIFGVLLIASSFTESGLLPSGHGTGRISEVVIGVAVLAYAAYRFKNK